MTQRKHRLGLLGVLAVAALAMAAFAASAQAITLPQFVYKNKAGTVVPVLKATVTAKQEGRGTLLVPSLNLELNCEKFTVKAGSFILTNEDADANLLYEECTALEMPAPTGKLEELPCTVSDVAGGNAEAKHVSATALLKPVEFAGGAYGVLASNIVATVNFKSGTGCPLPLKSVIKGEVCAEVKATTNETLEPLILLNEAIQKACPEVELVVGEGLKKDKLLYGVNESFIDGAATIKLTGEHEGFTLGVLLVTVP